MSRIGGEAGTPAEGPGALPAGEEAYAAEASSGRMVSLVMAASSAGDSTPSGFCGTAGGSRGQREVVTVGEGCCSFTLFILAPAALELIDTAKLL